MTTTFILLVCCYLDLRYREVGNSFWVLMMAEGVITTGLPQSNWLMFMSVTGAVVAFLLYKLKVYGGADAKCLVVLSLINYNTTSIYILPFHPTLFLFSFIFAIPFSILYSKNKNGTPLLIPITLGYVFAISSASF